MKLGIIAYSNEPEIVWNAFRLANFSLSVGDEVNVFLLGKGVDTGSADTDKINVSEQIHTFARRNGKIFACGTCLEFHQLEAPAIYTVATLKDLYQIIKESDKTVTF